eukprot:6184939-Pleurochrysis_carterae.AAC.3
MPSCASETARRCTCLCVSTACHESAAHLWQREHLVGVLEHHDGLGGELPGELHMLVARHVGGEMVVVASVEDAHGEHGRQDAQHRVVHLVGAKRCRAG